MEELIKTFHIDWRLVLAQTINFAIVVAVLWRFALKPIMETMQKRSEDIEKSLKDARDIERKLSEVEQEKVSILTEAKHQAQMLAEQARVEAEKLKGRTVAETKQELDRLAEKAKRDIQAEKEQAMRDAKAHIADLVVAATEKIIQKNVDSETNRAIIEEAVRRQE